MLDLHLHSYCSDGTMSPAELVSMACSRGLSAVSITDHDTIEGTEEAITEGARCGITVIPGLELSVIWHEYHFHLLGYDFDWHNERLLDGLRVVQKSRLGRNDKIIAKLASLGLPVDSEELRSIAGGGQTGRPHIARLLVDKKVVKTIDQAFARYLKKGACAYVSRYLFSANEAIDLIHAAGGLAVLAHPGQIAVPMSELETVVTELKAWGLDGIETFYPTQKGRLLRQLRALAHRLELIETGGSDYHGAVRPGTAMAGRNGFTVPSEILVGLRQRRVADSSVV